MQSTDDHHESAFLFQQLSILIQCYNVVAVFGTFTHNPRGWHVAIPALVLVFSLVLALGIYTTEGKNNNNNNNNDNNPNPKPNPKLVSNRGRVE